MSILLLSFIVSIFAVFDDNNSKMSGKKGDRIKRISALNFNNDSDGDNDTSMIDEYCDNDDNNTSIKPKPKPIPILQNTDEPGDVKMEHDDDPDLVPNIKLELNDDTEWVCGTYGHPPTSMTEAFCCHDECNICQWKELNINQKNDPFGDFEFSVLNRENQPYRLGHPTHPYNVLPYCYFCGYPTFCTQQLNGYRSLYKCPECSLVQFIWDPRGQYKFGDWLFELTDLILYKYRQFNDRNYHPFWIHYLERGEKLLKAYHELARLFRKFLPKWNQSTIKK